MFILRGPIAIFSWLEFTLLVWGRNWQQVHARHAQWSCAWRLREAFKKSVIGGLWHHPSPHLWSTCLSDSGPLERGICRRFTDCWFTKHSFNGYDTRNLDPHPMDPWFFLPEWRKTHVVSFLQRHCQICPVFPIVSSGVLPNFTPLRSLASMPQGHGVPVASRLWLHQEIGLPRCFPQWLPDLEMGEMFRYVLIHPENGCFIMILIWGASTQIV